MCDDYVQLSAIPINKWSIMYTYIHMYIPVSKQNHKIIHTYTIHTYDTGQFKLDYNMYDQVQLLA